MSLLDKFDELEQTQAQLSEGGVNPTNVIVEQALSPTESIIELSLIHISEPTRP